MYLNDYIAVWEQIAEQHKEIKGFYRANDNELSDALRNVVEYPVLILGNYDGELKESTNRVKYLDYMQPGIYLLDVIPTGDYDLEQTKMNRLKKIGFQIFARLTHDKQLCPRYFIDTQKDAVKYTQTDYLYEHCKGWLFEFTVYSSASEMQYNPNHWDLTPQS